MGVAEEALAGLWDSPPPTRPGSAGPAGRDLGDAASLCSPVIVGAGWEESRDQPSQEPRSTAEAGRSLGSPSVLLGRPLF